MDRHAAWPRAVAVQSALRSGSPSWSGSACRGGKGELDGPDTGRACAGTPPNIVPAVAAAVTAAIARALRQAGRPARSSVDCIAVPRFRMDPDKTVVRQSGHIDEK